MRWRRIISNFCNLNRLDFAVSGLDKNYKDGVYYSIVFFGIKKNRKKRGMFIVL